MIIWLNGTYGVGKTSVAEEIKRQLEEEDIVIFDPDELLQDIMEEIFCDLILNGGGVFPQNNKTFLNRVKEELKIYMDSKMVCIVSMALTTMESKQILWDYVRKNCTLLYHFILEADESQLIERINSDSKRMQKDLALNELTTNVLFLKDNFEDAIRINTNNKQIEEIAQDIVDRVNEGN